MNVRSAVAASLGIEVDFVAAGNAGRIAALRIADELGLREATDEERAVLEEGAIEALELAEPNWPCGATRAGTLRVCFLDGTIDLFYEVGPINDESNCKELTVAC